MISQENIVEIEDCYKRYLSYTDEKIIEILKNRLEYQNNAVTAAIKIAIERGIIFSEQDLFDERFSNKTSSGFTLFPEIENTFHKSRLISSIFRFIFLLSLLPVVYAYLNYSQGNLKQTIIGVLSGLSWFGASFLLRKTNNKVIYFALILTLCIVLIVGMFISVKSIGYKKFDIIILIVATLVPIYFLFYLAKLTKK